MKISLSNKFWFHRYFRETRFITKSRNLYSFHWQYITVIVRINKGKTFRSNYRFGVQNHNNRSWGSFELARCNVTVVISLRSMVTCRDRDKIGKYTRTTQQTESESAGYSKITCRLKIQFSMTFVRKLFVLFDRISEHLIPRFTGQRWHTMKVTRKSEERRWETREICSANSDDVYSPKANSRQNRDALITEHV